MAGLWPLDRGGLEPEGCSGLRFQGTSLRAKSARGYVDKGPRLARLASWAPYRCTLQPIRVKSARGYVDKGPFWLHQALVDIPFGRFGPCRCTLWPTQALSIHPLADSGLVQGVTGRQFLNSGILGRPSMDSYYLGLCRSGFWRPGTLSNYENCFCFHSLK